MINKNSTGSEQHIIDTIFEKMGITIEVEVISLGNVGLIFKRKEDEKIFKENSWPFFVAGIRYQTKVKDNK